MAFEFRFPDVGEGIAEGEIVEWKVRVGDTIATHQTLLVMETDKAVVEIPSPVAGTVLQLCGKAGERVPVGAVLAVIGQVGETPREREPESPPSPGPDEVPIPIPGGRSGPKRPRRTVSVARESVGIVGELEEAPDEEEQSPLHRRAGEPPGRRVRILPRDRFLAGQLGVNADHLRGTGPRGRVTEADVRRAAERGGPPPASVPHAGTPGEDEYGPVERVPVRGVRRKVAETMVRSLSTAAQVTTTGEARVGLLWHILEKEREAAAAQGVRLTPLAFLVRAAVGALRREPLMNAVFDEEAGEICLKRYYNVGIAVETSDGLIVPNVKGCDHKSILEIASQIQALSERARSRTLEVGDLKGGTFTLSNFGAIGGIYSTPILNPPEVGLLGIGRASDRPFAKDGAVAVGKILPLSLTFDHRAVDGATAQHFLNDVVRYLEDPDRILIGE